MTKIKGRLSKDVFERRPSTGSGRFAFLCSDHAQIFGQIVSIRVKTLGNTNLVASRHIKGENASLLVDVRIAKSRSLLKLLIPFPDGLNIGSVEGFKLKKQCKTF